MASQGCPEYVLAHDLVTAARTHCTCHSLTSCDTRCGRGVGWPCRTATCPRTFQPVRSPSSGSVRRTATRPRTFHLHCHSPPVRVDSLRLMPSGSVRSTATRPQACRPAPVTLPLAPRARRFGAFNAEWQCEAHCHSALAYRPPGTSKSQKCALSSLKLPLGLAYRQKSVVYYSPKCKTGFMYGRTWPSIEEGLLKSAR